MELREDRMTHEEPTKALFDYQKPDRAPFTGVGSGSYAMLQCGYTLTEALTDVQKSFNASHWVSNQYGCERYVALPAHTVRAD